MQQSNAPSKLVLPFASGGLRNSIPVTSQVGVTPGAASYVDGFPSLTMTPIGAGGKPPAGRDFNGILYEISAAARWFCVGGAFKYDATFAADSNVGGYPKGARVLAADGVSYWRNLAEGNTTDPDASGANWLAETGNLINTQRFTASGTYTPTPGTKWVVVEAVGGGGAGAGFGATVAGQWGVGGGGGSGAYALGKFTTGFSGVTVTIGAAGVATVGSAGGAGGTTSFGALLSAPGGAGAPIGLVFSAGAANMINPGAGAAVPSGANILGIKGVNGAPGASGTTMAIGGAGAPGRFSPGADYTPHGATGNAATGYGGGGAGGSAAASAGATAGGNGSAGLIIVWEYA